MGSWTCSVDPQLQESSQGSLTLMTWPDPSSLPQVSGVSQYPLQGDELHLPRQIVQKAQIIPLLKPPNASFVLMQMSVYSRLSKLFYHHHNEMALLFFFSPFM